MKSMGGGMNDKKWMRQSLYGVAAVLLAASAAAQSGSSVSPAPTVFKSANMDKLLAEISVARLEAHIRKLASFGTRNTMSETASETRGIGAARRWIKRELDACSKASGSRLQVEFDSHIAPVSPRIAKPTELINVVATLPGVQAESKDRIYQKCAESPVLQGGDG